jgi:hypothetical protein
MRRGNRRRKPYQKRNGGGRQEYESMLDLGRLDYFLYDAKQIFFEMGVEENVWSPLLSSIVAKASRKSIQDAGDFIKQKVKDGDLPADAEKPLLRLLNKYTKMR